MKAGYGTAYAKARRELLADEPRCCVPRCRRQADTADHYPPLATHEHIEGSACCELRPMCMTHNAALGAQLKSTMAAARRQRKTDASFLDGTPAAPRRLSSVSPPKNGKRPRSKRKPPDPPASLEGAPRLVTPLPGGVESWGSEVAAWSLEHLGMEFMPWQRYAIDGMLARRDATRLAHRRTLVSVARQNGKTQILKALIGWWLTKAKQWRGGEPQTILQIAHKLDLVTEVFEALAPILAELEPEAKVRWSYGRLSVTLPDKSRWLTASAKPSSGHGFSVDLVVLDELWAIHQDVVEVSLGPTQRARRSPLMAAFSTAGDQSSTLLMQWRETAIRAIDSGLPGPLYMAEWSPPPGADPGDPATWAWANPALGHTIDIDTLRDEADGADRNAFLRSSLNLWVSATKSWIQPGAWDECRIEPWVTPAGGVLACEISNDHKRWVAVRAWPTGQVETAFTATSEAEFWASVGHVLEDPKVALAVTPPLEIHRPTEYDRRSTTVGNTEIRDWTGTVASAIVTGRLTHSGEALLAEHVERAVGVTSERSMMVSSQKSPGPIELCRCMIWAWTLATVPKTKRRAAFASA